MTDKTTIQAANTRNQPGQMTAGGEPCGYIQPESLKELWFHTGTKCNLACWFCLEGSGPRADRIELLTYENAQRFIYEAVDMGVEQFSFTGGEPFVNPEFIEILSLALDHKPCLVLTNGTKPLREHFTEIEALADNSHDLKFRISLDFPDPARHDKTRGRGNFKLALDSAAKLHELGFGISIARHAETGEKSAEKIDKEFLPFLQEAGLPDNTSIISFPELFKPGATPEVPAITENCMTTYKDEKSRSGFMCNYSKMIVSKNGHSSVYACTLVDDNDQYDLGQTLADAMRERVMLKHHRCYACFSQGASCSEL